MNVMINDEPQSLADTATIADALAALKPTTPFAVALNREFVPRSDYDKRLQSDDQIEVIRPVTGG